MKNNVLKFHEFLNESTLNEKRIRFRGKNVADLAKVVSNSTSPSIFANGENYLINPSELDSDLKGTLIYATDQEGAEFEVAIKDIEFVELYESVSVDPRVKSEVISKLSSFFRVSPGALSSFKFDGNDNLKALAKALNASSTAGAEVYYSAAIEMAKKDLGINESDNLNESIGEITTEELEKVKAALPALEKLIEKISKVKLTLEAELEAGRRETRIQITSQDLSNQLSPLGKTVFSKINIFFWGGTMNQEGHIWFNPKLSYEHPSRGSNGTDFLWDSLWYDIGNDKWIEGRKF
jgi:hypothetical protein